jgi:hypothetical protein
VTDILRLDPAMGDLQGPAAALPGGGADFGNNERLLVVDLAAELAFEAGAEMAAARAVSSAGALARVYDGADPAGFVLATGRRAFRRPLTPEEASRYQAIFAAGERLYGAGFSNGAALVIRAMLQSPHFLYRSELGASGEPLDAYELASKLSFWLLGTTPSDELLDQAASGRFDSVAGIEAAARAMLEGPRATEIMRGFHRELYRADAVDGAVGGNVTAALRLELKEATDRFFDAVFVGGEGVRAILTSPTAFVGPGLAALYGIAPPAVGVEERTLDASRVGYFGQVPFLMANGNGEQSDPIRRGALIAKQVLCAALDSHPTPPPPLPPPRAGQTSRARVEEATGQCLPCHPSAINPLGFAFEAFDGLGRARAADNGGAVDTRGSYGFAAGQREFAGAKELMSMVADSAEAHACYSKKLASHALQRDIVERDRPLLGELAAVSRERSLKEMILSLVRHPAFRTRAEVMP